MTIRSLGAIVLLSGVLACAAQPVSFDSVRLADVLLESSWPAIERMTPLFVAGLKSQLVTGGMTDTASRVLSEEIQRSMTRETMSRALAIILSDRFTETETKELLGFMRSPLGEKYLQTNNDISSGTRLARPIFKQACDASLKRLSAADRSSLASACGPS
jgi:hypothetical protein